MGFNKAMHKLANYCRTLLERQVEDEENLGVAAVGTMKRGEVVPGGKFIKETLKEQQDASAQKAMKKMAAGKQELLDSLKDEFAVAPGEDDLRAALGGQTPTPGLLSVKRKAGATGPPGERFKQK